ncbi:hypothetical protein D3C80_916130 [compost metagenome]
MQQLARPAPTPGGGHLEPAQQPAIKAQQRAAVAHQSEQSAEGCEHQDRAAEQHAFQAAVEVVEQRVAGDPQHGAEKEQQVVELVGGKHCATARRTNAVAGQQGDQRQRATAAARGGADGELGGHDHAEAAPASQRRALAAEQQAQADGVDDPAQHDHGEQAEQQVRGKATQTRQQLAAAEQRRHQQRHNQRQEQPEQAVHRPCLLASQADLVSGSRPWRNRRCTVCSQ